MSDETAVSTSSDGASEEAAGVSIEAGVRAVELMKVWIDKARRLSQFADDAWQRMLCIETANVMEDMVVLEAGARHSLSVAIGVEAL